MDYWPRSRFRGQLTVAELNTMHSAHIRQSILWPEQSPSLIIGVALRNPDWLGVYRRILSIE